jgi:uncharacterized protein
MSTDKANNKINRREFLTASAAGAAALGMAAGFSAKGLLAAEEITVNGFPGVVFGRTGFRVTKIAFGGILVTEPPVLARAIDSGINLIHVSPGYQNGRSIECFGKVMKNQSYRSKVKLALKVMPDEALDKGLKTLNTDFVEIVIPPIDDINVLRSPELREKFNAAKAAGKCAHMGFACHTQSAKIIDTAVEMGYFDVILMSYANTSNPEFMASLERARAAGVAIMAMKGLPKRAEGAEALEQKDLYASLCSSMITKGAHAVLASMGSHQVVDMYRNILDKRIGFNSRSLESRYWAEQEGNYCAMCGNCKNICPNGVDVASIVRFRMYNNDYRMHDYARVKYAGLDSSCSGANCRECGLCESSCTRSLPLRSMIAEAHGTLA